MTGDTAAAGLTRAIVLGASGFVGRAALTACAEAGIATTAPGRADLDLESSDASTRLAATATAGAAIVFIAALTPSRGRNLDTLARNLRMGEQVARAVEAGGYAHVLYVSSDAVYADDANPVRETTPRHPGSLHGLMHTTREGMLVYAAGRAGVPLTILRPAALYGPGDPHNSYGPNRFVRTGRGEGKITLFGDGEERRDHVYVGDLAGLIVACLRHRTAGALNVATGRAWSFREVAELVTRVVPGSITIERLPRTGPVVHRHFDITELYRLFPEFRPTALPEGLARTAGTSTNEGRLQ